MEYEKDYSLLRPFDLEAAKRGELVCWHPDGELLEWVGPSALSGYAGCFRWLNGGNAGKYATYMSGYLRMAPLAWVEGKPVYKGDVLYSHGVAYAATAAGFVPKANGLYGLELEAASLMTWTQPKQKKQIKMLAYLYGNYMAWINEACGDPQGATRVPGEDKVIEVEE